MLTLKIQGTEQFNDETNQFVLVGEDVFLELEHSLVSVSKWESIHEKAFLSDKPKTEGELVSYIRCMSETEICDEVLLRITADNVETLNEYIHKKHSATRFLAQPQSGTSREKITSELIYYWMISLQIPWEAQTWHLERLLTMIEVCQRKNQQASGKSSGGTKASRARQLRQMNATNRARYGSSG